MSTIGDTDGTKAALRAALIEAERECQQSRADDYLARIIRDKRIIKAHCGGMSQKQITALVGMPVPASAISACHSPTTAITRPSAINIVTAIFHYLAPNPSFT